MDGLTSGYIEKHLSKTQSVGNPAVASGFTINVPASEYWHIRCLCFTLTTDANAANRLVSVDLIDGGSNKIGRFSSGFTQSATLATLYTFSDDLAVYGANAALAIGAPLPEIWLYPGAKLTVNVGSVQAGDQISAINLTVDQVYGGGGSDE